MNIYIVTSNKTTTYDSYDAHVVAAPSPEEALEIILSGPIGDEEEDAWVIQNVEHIGITTRDNQTAGIILSSFNAG